MLQIETTLENGRVMINFVYATIVIQYFYIIFIFISKFDILCKDLIFDILMVNN